MYDAMVAFFTDYFTFTQAQLTTYMTAFLAGLRSLFFYFIGYLLTNYILLKVIDKSLNENVQRETVLPVITNVLRVSFFILALISTLNDWGFEVSGIVSILGLTGFGFSIASQSVLSNMVSGIMIILYSPIRVGSTITLLGTTGEVIRVTLKDVTIKSVDGEKLSILPNSKVLGEVVTINKKALDEASSGTSKTISDKEAKMAKK